ncbi:hypothetical protein [Pseudogemmobacter humi]|uniref:Lipoprotein n=1 Tax=Pseudogemmobacter humi TaxID=2483812 RepID=A0A3P5X7X8_9RHOB|nr:hypothetical protein [Pseudogemmobacter humi]VDC30763.1 hypothetical protein XINFAN_02676 [Pseudogemmobacter humi]
MIARLSLVLVALTLAACANTDIQQMSKDTFKVQTHAAPACGPSGARDVAFRAAAVEVIRKGGDKFIIQQDSSGSGLQGNLFNMQQNYDQGMVVRMIAGGSAEAGNALSAREVLGATWQEQVAKGVGNTCT